MEQTTVLKLIAREGCEATSSLIVIWRLAWVPLSVRNFNPFVVGTISPRKPREINELKHDYAGREIAEDQTTTMRMVTAKESRPWEHLIFNDS